MLFSLVASFALLTGAFCTPTSLQHRKSLARRQNVPVENIPWHLSSLVITEADPNVNPQAIQSSISFNLEDTNSQLEFNTSCRYVAPFGITGPPITPSDAYHICSNSIVSFRYEWLQASNMGTIAVARRYNYTDENGVNRVVVFGWHNVTAAFETINGGLKKTEECASIAITAEIM
jgi:hypothetical protein